MPPGFDFFGFDAPNQPIEEPDPDSEALKGVKPGDVLRVGKFKWDVKRRSEETYTVPLVTKHGTKERKIYRIEMRGRGDGTADVWQIGGSGQRISSRPVATGKVRVLS